MAAISAPEWVNQQLFNGVLKQSIHDFQSIQNFDVKAAISGGENFLTIVLRIQIQISLKDDKTKNISFILKLPLVSDLGDKHDFHDLFVVENEMYDSIVPELEAIYAKNADLNIKFKPVHIKFIEPEPKCDYILMEDLHERGYKNLQRLDGLGQPEMESVLKKLAQWHAASAQRVAELGPYGERYQLSYFGEESAKMLENMNNNFNLPFLECMQQYNLNPDMMLFISNYTSRLTDLYIEFGKVDPEEFNVLNHGDFWCNNFMCKLNEDTSAIEDICFVDFQLPKYGTPAQDLFCLLMTTSEFSIKLKKFDHFIAYYHEELVAHLKLLRYPKKVPTLAELQANLQKNSLWAFVCAQRMLPVALLPSTSDANIENFMSSSDKGVAFKRKMLLNPSYKKQIEIILPWLIDRNYIN
ncbi:uncharacterized protein LOC115624126 [Scaptodrosophila lebanonensis]|uniref:Uncharacterized protein LOC115624126 n=1 Tax=Drosophila lebanonensis TaxID=7225 RepID=A0A6J2TCR3_DROLE|nr:uncharacterized protein LOC115624126 [Scaptodrosophila lebanonensis]